ncbi:MAG TPA: hypothetical protein VI432_00985 [Candidatus Paceibacterota bacterium]
MKYLANFSKGVKLYGALSILLWLSYMVLTFNAPRSESRLIANLTDLQIFYLQISVVLPILLIWVFGFLAVFALDTYIRKIKGSEDASALKFIYWGVAILVFNLVFNSFLSSIASYYRDNESLMINFARIRNYISVFIPIISFYFISLGSKKLLDLIKYAKDLWTQSASYIIASLSGILFAYLTFSYNLNRNMPSESDVQSYWLSDPMIALTIILPYAIGWFFAIKAIIDFYLYSKNIQGIIFKEAFSQFAKGFLTVTSLTIALQILSAAQAFAEANLPGILILLYIIIIILAVGYFYIMSGSRKLLTIEKL